MAMAAALSYWCSTIARRPVPLAASGTGTLLRGIARRTGERGSVIRGAGIASIAADSRCPAVASTPLLPRHRAIRHFASSKMSSKPRIVVVGAGVSGLTTALELARTGRYDVGVVAKHMPGDYDIEYASPWAGADYLPVGSAGSAEAQYEADTWPELDRLASKVPEAGIHFLDAVLYTNQAHVKSVVGSWKKETLKPEGPWYRSIMPEFRPLTVAEAAPWEGGWAFKSVCINVALYLPWLVGQLMAHGVRVRRSVLAHLHDAADAHPSGRRADLVVNCTGLASRRLPGVADATMFPARGQIAIVRNEPRLIVSTTGPADAATWGEGDESCYIMQRAAGGGTVLGGCYQKNNWDAEVDPALGQRILERAVAACPRLTGEVSMLQGREWAAGKGVESLSVIRHVVGLRPCREAGIRIELERLEQHGAAANGTAGGGDGKLLVVHNYGHGGYGYQASYGCSKQVLKLVQEAIG